MDTDMTAGVTGPKSDPAEIARFAVDGVEAISYEIVADETSRQVLAGLSGGGRRPLPGPVLTTRRPT
ncbi:hypothetical protein ACL02O_31430 [Micromonospora sp. MS34]|uniref:hypothetical protein n=1 Tax=Micromonospora sp. MS34 TaxID=3385971 RepID=UPI00399EF4F5